MAAVVGIDLGATDSGVALWDDLGRPVMVMDPNGRAFVPSCVALVDGDLRVGEAARRKIFLEETKGATRFKRDMETQKRHPIGGHVVTPTQLSTEVLRHLKEYTEQAVGPIGNAVVTIPANFNDLGRRSTMEAAHAAGLPVEHIINEPTAAALYYAHTGIADGKYAVYSLGGSTFDFSIVAIKEKSVEVIGSHGVKRLGGLDFDERLQQLLLRKYISKTGKELAEQYIWKALNLQIVEQAKRSLSERHSVEVFCVGDILEVTREEFEKAIEDLVLQAQLCCEGVMDEIGQDPRHLDGVLLVGGSTRMPCVGESVRKIFSYAPIVRANVDQVVALGASIYAGYRADPTVLTAVQAGATAGMEFKEITNKYFGTNALYQAPSGDLELVNSILIEAGTKIPCEVTQRYWTQSEGQRAVSCMMTESDRAEASLGMVTTLEKRVLPLPPGRPAGQEIRVTYRYDENQVLHGDFEDVETGETISLRNDLTRG